MTSEKKKGKFIHIFQYIYFKMLISDALSEEKKGEYLQIFQDIHFKMLISDALSEEKNGEHRYFKIYTSRC